MIKFIQTTIKDDLQISTYEYWNIPRPKKITGEKDNKLFAPSWNLLNNEPKRYNINIDYLKS